MSITSLAENNTTSLVRFGAPDHQAVEIELAASPSEFGFTLLETTIALLLLMIVALGSASLFSLSVYNNSGGSDRATSLAIAQQTLEALRSAQFSSTTTDASLNGGTFAPIGVVQDGRLFTINKIIDDNPATPAVDVVATSTLKAITITVRSQSIGSGWASGVGGTVTLMSQRAKADL